MNGRTGRGAGAVGALVVGLLLMTACVVPPPPPPPPTATVPYDFDGNGQADVAWVTSSGAWFRFGESSPFFNPGFADTPVPGDYDGNGRWEPATLRRSTGQWVTGGTAETIVYPAPPETGTRTGNPPLLILPVPADYNGDGRTDPAWYRESDATWWISGNASPIQFGVPYHNHPISDYDVPAPADYDGDGDDDIATYDPSTGNFKIRGQAAPVATGPLAGLPAPADYDGDGDADPAELHWYGATPDVPVAQAPGLRYYVSGKPPSAPASPALSQTGDGMPVPGDYSKVGHAQVAAVVNVANGTPGVQPSWSVESTVVAQIPANTTPAVLPAATWFSFLRLTFVFRCHYSTLTCA